MNFKVSLECPQCGGPVELEETQRLFTCQYCRSRLHITASGDFRYWLAPKIKTKEELILIPYWRFRGFSLNIKRGKTSARLIDTSCLGVSLKGFPVSLGIRTQSLPLKYITPDMSHFMIEPLPFKEILPAIQSRLNEAENLSVQSVSEKTPSLLLSSYIGETRSIVYQPFYLKDGIVRDAITNTPLHGNGLSGNVSFKRPHDWGLRFIAAQCPDCGWDLEGEQDSMVLFCRNCNTAWSSSEGMLRKINFHIAETDDTGCSIYLPFWKLRARISPIRLENFLDLIRFANLPKVPRPEWAKRAFHFWVPAFKIQPEKFLEISRIATLAQMGSRETTSLPSGKIFTTTLPSLEASEILSALLFEMARPRKTMIDCYEKLKIDVIDTAYVLVPFEETTYLLRHPKTGIGISKGLLQYGRYL